MTFLPCRLLAALVLLAGMAGLAFSPGSAHAAQSYDNCTGFIDSLPTTISTQGTWCLRKNLATNITSGAAIAIATNNVTIDCNDFKIGGLAAGDGSSARGIQGHGRQNATVRHCNVRGFYYGIYISGGAGHLVEDNRLDNNLYFGIYLLNGTNNLVQRNRVYDTGGTPESHLSIGIYGNADVIGNTVDGVFATATDHTSPYGISTTGAGNAIRNNRVRGLVVAGNGYANGIKVVGAGSMIDGNHVVIQVSSGAGISGRDAPTPPACSNNVIAGFGTVMADCVDAGGNTSL